MSILEIIGLIALIVLAIVLLHRPLGRLGYAFVMCGGLSFAFLKILFSGQWVFK